MSNAATPCTVIRFRNGRALRDFAQRWRARTDERLRVQGTLRDCFRADADRGVHVFSGSFDADRAEDIALEVDGATLQRWMPRSGRWASR